MPQLNVLLFDNVNVPLKVRGIRVELFDASTFTLLDSQNSDDLNPNPYGSPSNEWGVVLKFQPSKNPLDIYIKDPSFQYPGNAIRFINGQISGLLNIDLMKLPSGTGGQISPPSSSSPTTLAGWVQRGFDWSREEKKAVLNLVFNYTSIVTPNWDNLPKLRHLAAVAENWGNALSLVGISPDLLRP